jgi:AcrR family transcriptional regulator
MTLINSDSEDENTSESMKDGALSARQERALIALLSHPTIKKAARAAGLSEVTLWRYLRDKTFRRILSEVCRDARQHAVILLHQDSGDATRIVSDLMNNENVPPATRLAAARTIIDYTFHGPVTVDLATRFEELEEHVRIKQREDDLDAALRAIEEGR